MTVNNESETSRCDDVLVEKGNAATVGNHAGAAELKPVSLKDSLFGSRSVANHWLESPLKGLKLLGVSATYDSLQEGGHKELCIGAVGAKADVDGMWLWATSLGVSPVDAKVYYYTTKYGDRATADKVWRVFEKLPARVLTLIYVALHTEVEGGVRAFLAADYLGEMTPGAAGVIYYHDIRSKLSSAFKRGSSIMLMTETCSSTNIAGLPYKCWAKFVDGEPQIEWEETNFSSEHAPLIFTKHEWESKPLSVQSTATQPEGLAAHFRTGSVYTQALCDVMCPASPHFATSFRNVLVNIQTRMNDISSRSSLLSKADPQIHVLYCSRKIENDENFWSAFKSE